MSPRQQQLGLAAILVSILSLILITGIASPARAERGAVGLFHHQLAEHGRWVDYGKHGPVWYPTAVGSRWRPYMNGRWVPQHEGWMFETSEPWGWATYHYGNWFPTTQYGWVWSPGSTWYPSTAAWRSSDAYVGWAPIPPPDYIPEPAYYPEGGYVPGAPVLELLAAPLWLFIQSANFLLGFGQPYAPAYSYYGCNCLTPFNSLPLVYGATYLLSDFYYPNYAPVGYYCYGPPFGYVSRVSNVNLVEINNFVNRTTFRGIHNALPPERFLRANPALREALPADVREGRGFQVHRVSDVARAERELAHPNAVAPPHNVPAVRGEIPKAPEVVGRQRVTSRNLQRAKGMALPPSATGRGTPRTRTERRAMPKVEQPSRMVPRREFQPGAAPHAVRPAPREAAPVPRGHFQPEMTAPSREFRSAPAPRETFRPTPSREFGAPARQFHAPAPSREFHPSMPREFQAAPRPQFHAPAPQFHAPAPQFHPAPAPRGGGGFAPAPHGGGGGRR
jgi:hypothetical protein